ncbi:MAG: DUF3524 domain-containing protein [Phycisphaerales bacterium]|nr:DUF3524 domain-containing protein [Phycisphaerales bacterium]
MDEIRSLKVLGFEGWDGGSHLQVREVLSSHSLHQWNWVTRPARGWKWRLRTGGIELLDQAKVLGLLEEAPDVIFTTSMVGELRSLLPRHFSGVPLVLYMHENQAAYPFRHHAHHERERDYQFAITNLLSILSADLVIWNSNWNLQSFCTAIESLLSKSPDGLIKNAGERVRQRSVVACPPIQRPAQNSKVLHKSRVGRTCDRPPSSDEPVRIVWPHRWEHDKGPDTLLRLARYLRHRAPGCYRWTLLGEQYRQIPESIDRFLREFGNEIDHAGWVESREDYWNHLHRCDWVLSTARHEYFGIAVGEALLAGCLPWLPNRLSYPELVTKESLGLSPGRSELATEEVRQQLQQHLMRTDPSVATGVIDDHLRSVAGPQV